MSAQSNHVLGGVEASLAIAKVAFKRVLRGRAIAVVAGMSVGVPMLILAQAKAGDAKPPDAWRAIVETWAYLLAILTPILMGGSISEEIEERTAAYLWSRPLPRWSIVIGKLTALVPLMVVLMAVAVFLPGLLGYKAQLTADLGRVIAAVVIGTIAAAAVTAGITAMTPRHGTLLTLGYLVLIDRTLAWSEASIGKISIAHHILNLAGVHPANQSVGESIGWLAGLSAFWIGLAVWRIRQME